MRLKGVITVIIALFIISLVIFYFVPFNTSRFIPVYENNNFSLSNLNNEMQFYPNMRYPSNEVSYKISDCPLKKKNDMNQAFQIVENLTILKFIEVSYNEDISITCQDKVVSQDDMFIAGEGGVNKVIQLRGFNLIKGGEILLIRDSQCSRPNVALHELFHALGFKHSSNPGNIMYNVSDCDQSVSNDIIEKINSLYSLPGEPDLIIEDVSASMKGRFLNVNLSVLNAGFIDAERSVISVYAGDNKVKDLDIPALEAGQGEIITLENIFVPQINVEEITVSSETSFNEVSKENNKIKLKLNNN
jgi:hypothetical protein